MITFSPAFRFSGLAALFVCLACTLSACGGSDAARNAAPPPQNRVVAPRVVTDGAVEVAVQPAQPATASAEGAPAPAQPATATATPALPADGKPTAASRVAASLRSPASLPGNGQVAECWLPLVQRLERDSRASPAVIRYFCDLPPYSPKPMGVKVKELFTSAFLRKKRPDDGKPKAPPSRIYRNVVTQANMQKCQHFLMAHKNIFDAVEKKYPVPREILVSLLYVETRLGTFVGKDNALWSLACMAAADSPERLKGGLEGIPITNQHNTWLQAKLDDKSEWAYKELRALLAFCEANDLDPRHMPGSVYGAIGICQFMPSNLVPYGEDGDGDGVINLFSEADAIFSAARYLTKHGWKNGLGVAGQRAVLKRYNNLNIYANTILALAESVRTGVVQTGPPDSARVAKR